MFSSNDKSRWATVRALVDDGTFVIGKRTYPDPNDPKKFLEKYDSCDYLHPSDAGYKAMGDAIDLSLFRSTAPASSVGR